jgi:hypothetical protein
MSWISSEQPNVRGHPASISFGRAQPSMGTLNRKSEVPRPLFRKTLSIVLLFLTLN